MLVARAPSARAGAWCVYACWEWGYLRVLRAWGRVGLFRLPPYGSLNFHDRSLTHPPTVLPASHQRGQDAVVVQADQQHLPRPRWGARLARGFSDGGRLAAETGTLASGTATEAAPAPTPDARPVGGRVRRDVIPTASRPGGGVSQVQNRRGDRQHRREGRGIYGLRVAWGLVRASKRCAATPPRTREDLGAEGERPRETLRGPPLADLTQAARRDVKVPVRVEAENVRGQPTQEAAAYTLPWAGQGRPTSRSRAAHSSEELPPLSAALSA